MIPLDDSRFKKITFVFADRIAFFVFNAMKNTGDLMKVLLHFDYPTKHVLADIF